MSFLAPVHCVLKLRVAGRGPKYRIKVDERKVPSFRMPVFNALIALSNPENYRLEPEGYSSSDLRLVRRYLYAAVNDDETTAEERANLSTFLAEFAPAHAELDGGRARVGGNDNDSDNGTEDGESSRRSRSRSVPNSESRVELLLRRLGVRRGGGGGEGEGDGDGHVVEEQEPEELEHDDYLAPSDDEERGAVVDEAMRRYCGFDEEFWSLLKEKDGRKRGIWSRMKGMMGVGRTELKGILVADLGSCYLRLGWAGEDSPKLTMRSVSFVGSLKQTYVGDVAEKLVSTSRATLKHAVVDGEWKSMSTLIALMKDQAETLGIKDWSQYGLLLNTPGPALPTSKALNRLGKHLFGELGLGALAVARKPLLTIAGAGKRTGLLVDVGYETVSVVPVIDNQVAMDAMRVSEVGGKTVTHRMMRVLQLRKDESQHLSSFNVELLKKRHGYVCPVDLEYEMETAVPISFELPQDSGDSREKQEYPVSSAHFRGAEVLFAPQIVDMRLASVQAVILSSLHAAPPEAQETLAQNIVITGGAAQMPGFKHRLRKELNYIFSSPENRVVGAVSGKKSNGKRHTVAVEVDDRDPEEVWSFADDLGDDAAPGETGWRGASVLASLDKVGHGNGLVQWVKKSEWGKKGGAGLAAALAKPNKKRKWRRASI